MAYLFGPVYSKRLGRSLGVDVIPYKICNFDCIYCECGPTSAKPQRRGLLVDMKLFKKELDQYFSKHGDQDFDVVTITGSGEPTLEIDLVRIIQKIRKKTTKPIAILTNGSLMGKPEVREALGQLDVVLPSLDAVSPEVFQKIDQPAAGIKTEDIILGMIDFRKKYPHVKFWLEVLFVNGINDNEKEIEKIRKAIERIHPDQVNVVTVSRPPAYANVKAVSKKRMEEIEKKLWPHSTGLFDRAKEVPVSSRGELDPLLKEKIIETIKRRPSSYPDLEKIFKLGRTALENMIKPMIKSHFLRVAEHEGRKFIAYRPKKRR